jgi:hypothetical protein
MDLKERSICCTKCGQNDTRSALSAGLLRLYGAARLMLFFFIAAHQLKTNAENQRYIYITSRPVVEHHRLCVKAANGTPATSTRKQKNAKEENIYI